MTYCCEILQFTRLIMETRLGQKAIIIFTILLAIGFAIIFPKVDKANGVTMYGGEWETYFFLGAFLGLTLPIIISAIIGIIYFIFN